MGEGNARGERIIEFAAENEITIKIPSSYLWHIVYVDNIRWKEQESNTLHTGTKTAENACDKYKKKPLTGADCGSDHELLTDTTNIAVKLRGTKRENVILRYNGSAVHGCIIGIQHIGIQHIGGAALFISTPDRS